MRLKTPEEIKDEFAIRGLTVTEWARHMGFSPALVHQILAGRIQGKRGQSHVIAVRLGLKEGVLANVGDLVFSNIEEEITSEGIVQKPK